MTKIEKAILLLVANGYAVHRVTTTPVAVQEEAEVERVIAEPPPERGAYSVNEFCALHGIGRTMFYQMVKDGTAPKVVKVGRRSLITREAAEAWRKQ